MLVKVNKNISDFSSKSRCFSSRSKFKFLSKMVRLRPYERMSEEDDVRETEKKQKKAKKSEVEENIKYKETKKEKNKKTKKKTWKLIRQATLSTCRYIGMGVAHMSPATAYTAPDYYIDPKMWDKSFSTSYKGRPTPTPAPEWTNTMLFTSR